MFMHEFVRTVTVTPKIRTKIQTPLPGQALGGNFTLKGRLRIHFWTPRSWLKAENVNQTSRKRFKALEVEVGADGLEAYQEAAFLFKKERLKGNLLICTPN